MEELRSLLDKATSGDSAAFASIARQHETRLFRQAYAMCRDFHLAEDLAQETLLEAWKSLARYNRACRLSTWLFSILLHRYWKSQRKTRSRPMTLGLNPADQEGRSGVDTAGQGEGDPRQALACKERDAMLRRAIGDLPTKHRDVLLMRFFGDATIREISISLDIPAGTVKSRLHNGLEKLRRKVRIL